MWSSSIEILNPHEATKDWLAKEKAEKKNKFLYNGYNFSITKREVIFSVIILAVMLAFGFLFSSLISNAKAETNEKYYLAMKITDEEQFQYGLRTSVGNALVCGDLTAANPVSMSVIDGEYFAITATYYRYTKHIDYVNHYDEDGNLTWVEEVVTYSWDYSGSDNKCTDSFTFMGKTFDNNLYGIYSQRLDLSEVCLDKENVRYNYYYNTGIIWDYEGNTRIEYSAVPITVSGTMEAKLNSGKIYSFSGEDRIYFRQDKTIENVMDDIESGAPEIVFWVFWSILTIVLVCAFIYYDNRWLD